MPYKKSRKSARRRTTFKKSKRKTYKRRAYKPKAKVDKKQSKQINAIWKALKSDQALHTHRRRDFLQIGSSVNQVVNTGIESINTSNLEAAMAFLRYYDPSVPGTLITADAATGTYTRQIHFKSVSQKLTCRNNYQVPCWVTVYGCTPKNDTNITAPSFYSSGVTDQTIGPLAVTSPLLWPTDIKMVTDNWNMKRMKHKFLQPGAQFSVSHYGKSFDYDPSNVDTHNLQFQKKYQAFQYVIRVEGVYGHDTAAAEATTLQAQIEAFVDSKFVMTYDAGVNLVDYSADNNASSSFTNGGVSSNKPVSDNQAYSVA
jgi:hypothetical protein